VKEQEGEKGKVVEPEAAGGDLLQHEAESGEQHHRRNNKDHLDQEENGRGDQQRATNRVVQKVVSVTLAFLLGAETGAWLARAT